MGIIRTARPQSNFYVLDKQISEDRRLSWAARGLLIFLLGKPDHWQVSVEHLYNESPDKRGNGREAIYGYIKELIVTGYVSRKKRATGEMDYHVSEVAKEPQTANPNQANPNLAHTALVSIEDKQVLKEANLSGTPDVWEESFDQFWQQYPNKVAKANALKVWKKIKPDDALLAKILASLEVAKNSDGWKKDDGRFIPHPTTWLNGRRWEDEIAKGESSEEVLDPRAKAPPSWFKLPPGAKWTPGKGVTW